MKKLLAVVMAVACATAFATDYTWTGGGTAGSWKDPANWGGGGYPHLRGDTATVAVDADITVDETVTITALNATSGAKVTVRDDGSAELHFMPFILTTGTKVTCGPNATGTGTELTLLAKVVSDKDTEAGGYDRSDPSVSDGGVLRFGGTWTNGTMTAIVYLNGTDGAYDFRGGDFYTPKNLTLGWKSGAGNQSKTINMAIGEGAVVVVPQAFLMGGNAQTPNTYVEQEDGSTFTPINLNMGNATSSGTSGSIEGGDSTNTFVKKGGQLTASTLTLGMYLSGFFLQEGGTSICTQVNFPVVSNAYSRLIVTGGTFGFVKFNANAGFPGSPTPLANPDNVEIAFSDCTVLNNGAYENQIGHPVLLDGDLTFDSTKGKATGFTNPVIGDRFNPTMTENAKVDLTMTRDFEQTAGSPVYRNLTVASGCTYTLSGGRLTVSGGIALADASAAIDLKGGTLAFPESMSPSGVFRVSGDVNIEVAEGKTVNLYVELGRGGKIVQTGAGTLNLVYCGNSVLTSGDYSFDTLAVGAVDRTTLTIAGANVTANKLSFGSKTAAFTHGKIVLESGSLKFGVIAGDTVEPGEIELQGGTLKFDATVNLSAAVRISGATTIEVASGKTLSFLTPPTFADDAKIVKTGAGTVAFAANTTALWRGDFDIEEGVVQLMKWATLKHDPAAASATHTITIGANGGFTIGEKSNIAQVAAWVDYVIADGGYVACWERNTVPVNSITVDGAVQPVGFYLGTKFDAQPQDVTGWFRHSAANYDAALVIPYRWTGAGGDAAWSTAANWRDNAKPTTATSKETFSFADLSAAEHVVLDENVQITGLFFMPADGRDRAVVEGVNGKKLTVYGGNYQIASFVAPDCELVLRNTCLVKSSGSPIFRSFGGQITLEGDENFKSPVMGGLPYIGTRLVVKNATNETTTTYALGCYAGAYSDFWFDAGVKQTHARLYTSLNSIPCLMNLGVRNGGDLTLADLYISRTSGDNQPMFTVRDDTSKLTLTEGLYLGTRCPTVSGNRIQVGGSFTLESGTVTTPKIANELDNNYFYLKGGELRLGAGGITNSTSRKDHPITNDSTTYQTTPAFYFQGGTLTATDAFDDVLVTELTTGTRSVLDTDEFDVRIRGDLIGKGSLVKRGTGALVLDGAVKAPATLVVDAGTLVLGDDFSQTANPAALIVPSVETVALTAEQNLTVGAFIVNGKPQSGTVPCGEGTVTVAGAATDWLTAAQVTANYTKTFDADATLGSFDYENYVSDAGVLKITGAADAKLTLSAGTTISVAAGDTLVFDLPVCLAGALTITGGGEVKFTANAPVIMVSGTASATVKGGTWLTVCAAWTRDCVIWTVSSADDARLCRLTVDGAGSVNQSPLPMNGSLGQSGNGTGGEMVLSNGGTFRMRDTGGIFGTATVQTQRLILVDGGVLILPGMLRRYPSAGASTLEILDYGGVLTTDNYAVMPILKDSITVELHGKAMEIRPSAKTAPTINAVEATFTGSGALLLDSTVAPLTLAGDLSGVTNVIVRSGELILRDAAVDTLSQSDVSLDRAAATLSIAGTATIDGLYLDGVQARQGLYGKGIAPKAKFLAPIESGFLDVKDGIPPGTLIIVR